MIPRRTVAPVDPVVTLDDMKGHIREMHDFEDMQIQRAIDAAVSHLDGWRGVLGRGIMTQTWEVDCPCAGTFRLPLPDAVSATASVGTVELTADALGSLVKVSQAATVSFVVRLPEELLPAVQHAVRMLAAHFMDNRSSVTDDGAKTVPMGFEYLTAPVRWVLI